MEASLANFARWRRDNPRAGLVPATANGINFAHRPQTLLPRSTVPPALKSLFLTQRYRGVSYSYSRAIARSYRKRVSYVAITRKSIGTQRMDGVINEIACWALSIGYTAQRRYAYDCVAAATCCGTGRLRDPLRGRRWRWRWW